MKNNNLLYWSAYDNRNDYADRVAACFAEIRKRYGAEPTLRQIQIVAKKYNLEYQKILKIGAYNLRK